LYPSDHENEARVVRAQEMLSLAERDSEEASSELGKLILTRYILSVLTVFLEEFSLF
jgi:hypothetical protein